MPALATPLLARLVDAQCLGLVRMRDPEQALGLGRALLEAGLKAIEVSFVTPDAPRVIAELAALGQGIVGAGTVLEQSQATAALEAGARFLISPGQIPEIPLLAHEAGAIAILGGLTPVEIVAARKLGADFVKIFPVRAMGGAAYIRDIRAPLPDVPVLVSGGVDPRNYRDYLAAGAQLCTLGSGLVPEELLAAGDWSAVAAHVRAALGA